MAFMQKTPTFFSTQLETLILVSQTHTFCTKTPVFEVFLTRIRLFFRFYRNGSISRISASSGL